MDIKGKFFPVGHGLTYAFKIDDVHVLFDINRKCNLKDLNQFFGDQNIDFMILSHLHNDHINGLKKLSKVGFSINKIYIPYLDIDEQYLVELQFLIKTRQYQSYPEILENIRNAAAEMIEVEEYMSIKVPIWQFNIHQSRGNTSQMVNDIKNALKKIGINNNNDLKAYIQKKGISDIKNTYQKIMNKFNANHNQTSIFLEHGPIVEKELSVSYDGLEFLSLKHQVDKRMKTHSLITGDMKLLNNKSIIDDYCDKLGFVLVPHHSGECEWNDFICKKSHFIIWIVTIAQIGARPYGKVVQDIYNHNHELYICDKKYSFEYEFF